LYYGIIGHLAVLDIAHASLESTSESFQEFRYVVITIFCLKALLLQKLYIIYIFYIYYKTRILVHQNIK